jgi:hypothetical protein
MHRRLSPFLTVRLRRRKGGGCDCVPDYPETQAYVARVLGLMGGAGELAAPALEVRLVS